MIRLGIRFYINGYSDIDKGKQREFELFVEVNRSRNIPAGLLSQRHEIDIDGFFDLTRF